VSSAAKNAGIFVANEKERGTKLLRSSPVASSGGDILEIALHVIAGRFFCNALENPVEIGDAIEPAIIGYGGNTVIVSVSQLFAGFVDAHFIQEGYERMQRMFLEITAKSLRRHMRLFGSIFQRDGLVILLHDEIVNGADADAFVFAV